MMCNCIERGCVSITLYFTEQAAGQAGFGITPELHVGVGGNNFPNVRKLGVKTKEVGADATYK